MLSIVVSPFFDSRGFVKKPEINCVQVCFDSKNSSVHKRQKNSICLVEQGHLKDNSSSTHAIYGWKMVTRDLSHFYVYKCTFYLVCKCRHKKSLRKKIINSTKQSQLRGISLINKLNHDGIIEIIHEMSLYDIFDSQAILVLTRSFSSGRIQMLIKSKIVANRTSTAT